MGHCSASNCRQDYLEALIEAMGRHKGAHRVDSLGSCKTTRAEGAPWVEDTSAAEYLFMWAVENANCRDYITEKLTRAVRHGAVPIVFAPMHDGRPTPDYDAVLPRGSYVNIADFQSQWHLVQHLAHVARNATAYRRYHWFRHLPAEEQRKFRARFVAKLQASTSTSKMTQRAAVIMKQQAGVAMHARIS